VAGLGPEHGADSPDLPAPADAVPPAVGAAAQELAERLLAGAVTTMEMLSIQLGARLGLYQALAGGATDARGLAGRAGIHPRYAREWLEQQAVAGLLRAEPGDRDPYARTFTLPGGHRETLLDADSPYYMGALPGFLASFASVLPEVAGAFRGGGGVAYGAYGEATRHGIAGLNRPMFRAQLAGWIAAMPDVQKRLTGGPARVLDLGCGTGASSVAIAQAYPHATVTGVDLDEASVREARRHAAQEGLTARVAFQRSDAAALTGAGDYGFSVLHCLPATRAEGAAVEAGTGLVAGAGRRARRYSLCVPARPGPAPAPEPPTQTVFRLQNSRIPCADSSRPYPELFTPPNGSDGYEVTMPLTNTAPASRSAANRSCSSGSLVQALAPSPNGEPLAISTAWS
jgi:hypothetical protein